MAEKFSPKKAKTIPEEIKTSQESLMHDGPTITGSLPPQMREMLGKNNQQNMMNDVNSAIEKTNTTGNPNLDAMLLWNKKFTENYRTVDLPSRGKFYNGNDGPTDGRLHIRPMTGHEQEILTNGRDKRLDPLSRVFKQCIQEGYDTQSFLMTDREWLTILLRGICLGKDFECSITCPVPYCSRTYRHTIDLDQDIFVEYCPDNFGPENLKDAFPICGYKFVYRYPTNQDIENFQREKENKIGNFGSEATNSNTLSTTALLANYVSEIEGPLGPLVAKHDLSFMIKNLHYADFEYLQQRISNPPFGQDTDVTIECPYCGEESKVKLPLDQNFFSPRLTKE